MSPFVIAAISIGLIVTIAFGSGFPFRQLDLNDTGVWVSNDAAGEFGRFNKAAIGFDARLAPPGERIAPFSLDIFQDANAAFGLDARAGRLTRIDTVLNKPVTEQAVGVDGTSVVGLRGGTIALMDRLGRAWAAHYDANTGVADLGAVDATLKPLAELGLAADAPAGSAAMAVGVDGAVVVAGVNGQVLRLTPAGGGFQAVQVSDGRPALNAITVTLVGDALVSLDAAAGKLVLPKGQVVSITPDPAARLQQPGPSAATVLVATATGLLRVDLTSGQVMPIDTIGGGQPADPVHLDGCDFGAWAGVGRVIRACGNADPSQMQVAKGLVKPAFRINRDQIVLNDQANGLVFDVDLQASIDWPLPNPQQTQQTTKDDQPEPAESEPKAVDDELYARPDRTTVLHLLDNDTNTVAGVLSIRQVSRPNPSDGVRLQIAPDGQTVLVSFGAATAAVRFTYTISDGSRTDDGEVVVHNAGDQENAPVLRPNYVQPAYAVAAYGELSIPIVTEWRDAEGDPVTLLRATDADGTSIPVTSSGQIDYTPGEARGDAERVITYEVTDGRSAPVAQTVRVRVLGTDSLTEVSPVAQPDVVRGEVGTPITITPLANDVPGADPRNLAARLVIAADVADQANLTVTTDQKLGRITVIPQREGPYTLSYAVGFGSATQVTGLIRVDALRGEGQLPVAMPDQAAMRGRNPVLIDVLANDYDPGGNLLSVIAATAADPEQVQVEVIAGRWLRVLPQGNLLTPNPQAVHYTISNGSQVATGDALITQLDDGDADRVLARKDAAIVRVGDSVLIPVLNNDTTVSGQQLHLATDGLGSGHDGQLPVYDPSQPSGTATDVGQAYVHGNQVRYVPPATVAGSRQVRIPYTVLNTDGDAAQSEAVVTIKAEPDQANPDRAPVASAVETRVASGSRLEIPIQTSGQDPDGDSVVVAGIASAPKLGRVLGYGPTTITYEAFPTDGLVGTDSFDYLVTDRYGRTGTGTVRISVTPPGQTQPPVAIDDQVVAAPGVGLQLRVMANDYFARDDSVAIAPLESVNNPLPAGAHLSGATGPLVLTAPGEGDQPTLVNYALVGNAGTGPSATVKITSKVGYNNPPVIRDQVALVSGTTASVDLLAEASDLDGDIEALRAEPLLAVTGANLVGSRYTVPLLDRAQAIPYQVTDAAGGVSAAVVYVPALGAGAPRLKTGASISLPTNSSADFALGDYVESPRGKDVRIASAKATAAPATELEVKVDDPSRFTLTSKNGYVGPGSVTLQVMDSASLTDDGVLTATISIPVQVGDRTPVLRCPADPQTIVQGGEIKDLDITTLCHVWSPDPDQLAGLTYSADWATPIPGVDAAGGGHRVRLEASGSAVGGSSGVLTIGVIGTAAKPASLPVTVVAAGRPKVRSVSYTDIKANTPVVIPLSLSSPLRDAQPKILAVDQTNGGKATVSFTDTTITVTPDLATSGALEFRVLATDVGSAPDRTDRQAIGTIRMSVYSRPDPPTGLKSSAVVESGAATLSWVPGKANGAAIDGYRLKVATGAGAGATMECRSSPCRFTGLQNGKAVTFQVQAHNKADWSDWSQPSAAITPDTLPGAPSSVSVSEPKDGSLLVSWGTIPNQGSALTRIHLTYGGRDYPVNASATSTRVSGLDNNQVYTFTVTAENRLGLGPSASAKGQSSGRPLGLNVAEPSPQDLVGPTTQTVISWSLGSANGPTPVTYDVQRSDGHKVCSGVTARNCTDDSVAFDGTTYTYAVTATNATGGSEHAASASSPSWRATGTPDAWGSWSADPTGADGTATISYTVPPSRGASSTVAVMNGSGVLRDIGSQTGGVHSLTLTGLSDGSAASLRMRVCNEANRCSLSSTKSVTTFGPLGTPNVSGSASGDTVNASATGNGNGATATLTLYIDGTSVDTATGTGALTVSRSGYSVGYNHTATIRATLTTGSTTPSRSNGGTDTTTVTTPAAPRSVSVAQASNTITTATCEFGCNYVLVTLSGFSGSTNCSIWTNYTGDHVFSSYTAPGNGTHNSGAYFGYWGSTVWAVCDGVSSPHVVWRK